MSSLPLVCFMRDKSVFLRNTGPFGDGAVDQGHGFLTDLMKSYFVEPIFYADVRPSRLSINTVSSAQPMELVYDEHFNTALTSDTIELGDISSTERDQLFNIIEQAMLAPASSIETVLVDVNNASTFGIYKAGSMMRSLDVAPVTFFADDVVAGTTRQVHNYISFTCRLGVNQNEISFKVFFSREVFLADYPHTEITRIIFPGEPQRLLTGNYSNALSTLASVTSYITDSIRTPIQSSDNTGVFEYRSKYNPNNSTSPYSVTFAVLYKGRQPEASQVRIAIREELIALNLTPDPDDWRTVLPDLFTNGHYFFIPMWDNVTSVPGASLNRGSLNLARAARIVAAVFPAMNPQLVEQRMVVTRAASSSMYIIGVPAEDNDLDFMSLITEHPTYQPVDSRGDFFDLQETKTKEFSISFANAVAVLNGASNDSVYSEDEIAERTFITFINNFREYHILKSDSFPALAP